MKIAIGFRTHDGPWGGGNRFAIALSQALEKRGHLVVNALRDDDIDLALLLDPRARHPSATFNAATVLRYRCFKNPNLITVHRINECDERKGTRGMNGLLKRANHLADHTVFVGEWLRHLDLWQNGAEASWSTIHNGADTAIFNAEGWQPWSGDDPLKLVTHHWGGNWMKGFDVYQKIDSMLDEVEWAGKIEFTYVGNLPDGFAFQRTRHVPPLDGHALADELRRHHVYLTASINEPGGNHQNEGALCGLPLLYRESGCMPEYCRGFGLSFDSPDNFVDALGAYLVHRDYMDAASRMPDYPHTADRTTAAYIDLFESLLEKRSGLLQSRKRRRNLAKTAAALWPY
ncbi:MAG: hypothetical protein NXI27_15515 [Alphaproteobacteria bacterium]|nr:hypothetical protein [Alphaproteobacteria bacterium]